MSFHGGAIGVIVVCFLLARAKGMGFMEVGDFISPLVPPGLFFGRIGNFINAELWGRPTDLPWGMPFPGASNVPRHPSQLYEAGLEGLALFAILWWYSSKPRPAGAVGGLFLLGYGVFRFLVEFAREPDAHLGFVALHWMSMGQILCLPMIALGGGLIWWGYVRER
jgi:phosphatidylglycerol:prolipoprotein diacylglycerol transferase